MTARWRARILRSWTLSSQIPAGQYQVDSYAYPATLYSGGTRGSARQTDDMASDLGGIQQGVCNRPLPGVGGRRTPGGLANAAPTAIRATAL